MERDADLSGFQSSLELLRTATVTPFTTSVPGAVEVRQAEIQIARGSDPTPQVLMQPPQQQFRSNPVPPHAFYGEVADGGVLIYPGLLVAFIADITGASGSSPPGFTTFSPQPYIPDGMGTGDPVLVEGTTGDVVCLCAEITAATNTITDVRVEVNTPAMITAQDGGTLAVEIGMLTAGGFLQKLRSDFYYTSLIST